MVPYLRRVATTTSPRPPTTAINEPTSSHADGLTSAIAASVTCCGWPAPSRSEGLAAGLVAAAPNAVLSSEAVAAGCGPVGPIPPARTPAAGACRAPAPAG